MKFLTVANWVVYLKKKLSIYSYIYLRDLLNRAIKFAKNAFLQTNFGIYRFKIKNDGASEIEVDESGRYDGDPSKWIWLIDREEDNEVTDVLNDEYNYFLEELWVNKVNPFINTPG